MSQFKNCAPPGDVVSDSFTIYNLSRWEEVLDKYFVRKSEEVLTITQLMQEVVQGQSPLTGDWHKIDAGMLLPLYSCNTLWDLVRGLSLSNHCAGEAYHAVRSALMGALLPPSSLQFEIVPA